MSLGNFCWPSSTYTIPFQFEDSHISLSIGCKSLALSSKCKPQLEVMNIFSNYILCPLYKCIDNVFHFCYPCIDIILHHGAHSPCWDFVVFVIGKANHSKRNIGLFPHCTYCDATIKKQNKTCSLLSRGSSKIIVSE